MKHIVYNVLKIIAFYTAIVNNTELKRKGQEN